MPLANKPLDQITEADLQELIDNQVAEGKEYDYKLSVGNSDKDKKEFLADASSFANTIGGHLIIGMDEEDRIPTAIIGLQGSMDTAINRLENMLRDGIAPRIQGVDMREILTSAGNVLIIRIPRSWSAPHMVTFAGNSRFFARNSAGKYQLDVNELRSVFTLSETASERIRNFRLDRIAKIAADQTPIKLSVGAKLVLHVVPIGGFVSTVPLSGLSLDKRIEWQYKFAQPIVITSHRYNLDGLLFHGTSYGFGVGVIEGETYIQIFRNGAIEFTDTWLLNGLGKYIPGNLYEPKLVDLLPIILSIQAQLEISPPVVVMLTLLGVNGYTIVGVAQHGRVTPLVNQSMEQNDLLIPDIVIEDFNANLPRKLKDIFDVVWQACGWPQSKNYDEAGSWKPLG